MEGKFREVVSQNKGIVTLGIGTTISGIPITGISVSTLDDLNEFVQMGINAEKLTGKKVLPMTPEEITAAVKSMRDALPSWIWDAEKDLETAIQNDPTLVPLAMTQEVVDEWRATLG